MTQTSTTSAFNKRYWAAILKFALQLVLCIVVYTSISEKAYAQSESNRNRNWFWAGGAGIKFPGGTPLTGGPSIPTPGEGVATISDLNGNILFTTDGGTIWDNTNTAVKTGLPATLSTSATQRVVAYPVPCSASKYYVAFLGSDAEGHKDGTYPGVSYVIYDAVAKTTTTPTQIVPYGAATSTEKLTIIPSSDGVNYWLVNPDQGTSIKAFQSNTSGTLGAAVNSSVTFTNWGGGLSVGESKSSAPGAAFNPGPNKVWYAMVDFAGHVNIFTFDQTTGTATGPKAFTPSTGSQFYGAAISPDGHYLFISSTVDGQIRRYDLTSATPLSTEQIINVPGLTAGGGMQIGPDGKLYTSGLAQNKVVAIDNPNNTSVGGYTFTTIATTSNGYGVENQPLLAHACPTLITAQPANKTISTCPGNTSFSVTAANACTYSWEVSTDGGATWNPVPNSAPYGGISTNTLTLTSVGTSYNGYQYRATASTAPSGSCKEVSSAATLTVSCGCPPVTGTPSITGTSTICSGNSTTLVGNVPAGNNGYYYEWQKNGVKISSGTIGTASATTINSPSITVADNYTFRLVNAVANIGDATCYKEDVQAVTVNPVPVAPTISGNNTPYCDNSNISISAASTGAPAGTVYTWTMSDGSTSTTMPFTATGATSTTVVPTSVKASYTNNGVTCTGPATALTVTVKTKPTVTLGSATQTICSGSAMTSVSVNVSSGTGYTWKGAGASATGFTSTTTIVSATSGTIQETLTSSPATSTGTVTYTITPTNGTDAGGATCSGAAKTHVVTINPIPVAPTISGNNSPYCDNSNISISAASTGAPAGTVYTWTMSDASTSTTVPFAVTGATSTTVVPTSVKASYTNAGKTCTGPATALTVTVKTKPTVALGSATQTICSGSAMASVSVNVSSGTGYTWKGVGVSASGFTSTTTTVSATSGTIQETLTSSPVTSTGTVTYTITPTNGTDAGGATCSGPAQTHVVTINPIPVAPTISGNNSPYCDNSNISISVASTGAPAGTVYTWTMSDASTSTTVPFAVTGATSTTVVPTSVKASYTNAGKTCTGPATALTVTVKTKPTATLGSASQPICSGSPMTSVSVNVANGTGYTWKGTGTNASGFTSTTTTVAATSGTIQETLTSSPATATGTVTYTVTPTNGTDGSGATCSGPAQAHVVTVNPIPAAPTATGPKYCEGDVTSPLSVTGSNLLWYTQAAPGGTSSATAPTITSSPVGTTSHWVSQTVSGCEGPRLKIDVLVVAKPVLPTIVDATACNNGSASFNVTPSNTLTNATYQWDAKPSSGSFTAVPSPQGTVASLSYNPVTTAMDQTKVHVTVTETVSGKSCSTTSNDATLNINNNTTISSFTPNASTLCEGDALTLTAAVGGTAPFNYVLKLGTNIVDTKTAQASSSYSYTISSVSEGTHNGTYTLEVTSACSGNPTSTVGIAINKVIISSNPVATSVCSGTSTSFTVGTTGSVGALTYKWYKGTSVPGTLLTNGTAYSGVNTATLTLNSATSAEEGSYYVEVFAGGACAKTSTPVAFTLTAGSTITTQPTITSKCVGDAANMSIGVTPAATSYQWYKNTDATPVADGGTITGATTSTLNISSVVLGDAGTYYVKATTTCGVLTSDKTAVLAVNGVDITAQPTDQGTCNNGNVTFAVTATGPNLTYEWQVNTGSGFGNMTPSQTNSSLGVNPVLTSMDGYTYRVNILSNGLCPVTSNVAKLSVTNNTSINTQPVGGNYCVGDALNLSVSGSGTGTPTYIWYHNGTAIPGATNDTYSVASIAAGDAGTYKVDVTTLCGTATSNTATVKVNNVTINTQPINAHVCEGSNVSFSVTATGLGTVTTYQWQVGDGTTFTDINGQTASSYSLTTANTDDNKQYQVIIKDDNACPVTSIPSTLVVDAKTVITSQPVNAKACEGSPFSLSVTATTEGTATYAWTPDLHSVGSNSTYSVASSLPSDQGSYSVTISNSGLCPSVTSNTVTVTITPIPVKTMPVTAPDICLNSAGAITVASSQTNVTYQVYNGAIPVGSSVPGNNGNPITLTVPSSELTTAGVHSFVVKADPGAGCPLVTLDNPGVINVVGKPGAITGPTTVCTNANTGLVFGLQSDVPAINNPVTYNWTISGGSVNQSTVTGSNSFIADLNAAGTPGTITLVSVSTASVTCPVNDSKIVNQLIAYSPEGLAITEDTICAGNMVTFTITNSNAVGYSWIIGAGVTDLSPTVNSPKTFQFDTPGDITVAFKPSHPCKASITPIDTTIHVIAYPVANAGPDVHLDNIVSFNLDGSGSSTNTTENIYQYAWTSSDGGALITDSKAISTTSIPSQLSSTYSLMVSTKNEASCMVSDEMTLIIEPIVKVPNVFSPNHDGNHDLLMIKNIEFFPKAMLYIYNQWGELIHKDLANIPWDGTRDGTECAVSAYYYVLELNQGNYKPLAGDVTIVR